MLPTLRIVGEDVLFTHWPVDADTLRSVIPEPLDVDTFDGTGWITVLAHEVTEATLDAVPVSPLRPFGEVDLRTYVQYGDDSGVYFFSCNTGQELNALLGEQAFGLPHHRADVSFDRRDDRLILRCQQGNAGSNGRFDVTYQPTGPTAPADAGSLMEFLVERHTYFTPTDAGRESSGSMLIGSIERDPWQIGEVEARIRANTMFGLIDLDTPDVAPTFHYSPRFESRFVDRERVSI